MKRWIDRAQELPCGKVTTFQMIDRGDGLCGYPAETAEMLDRVAREHKDHPQGSCKRDRQ